MAQMTGKYFGTNWLGFLASGSCCGVLGVILISLTIELCWIFLFEFIFDQGLMNIPLVGENFMWSNNCDSLTWFRIDRFLLSLDCVYLFLDVSRKRLLRILSDRFPLLFDCGVVVWSIWYFKFDNMWLKSERFVE